MAATLSKGKRGGIRLKLAHLPGDATFSDVYQSAPGLRIDIIKGGIEADFVPMLAGAMGTSKDTLLDHLGLARATVDRKIRENKKLSQHESERVLGMAKLIGLVQTMVQGADGADDFDAAAWLAKWVDEELPALGGKKPAQFLDTLEGQEMVANTLQRMQSGAYS